MKAKKGVRHYYVAPHMAGIPKGTPCARCGKPAKDPIHYKRPMARAA